MTDWPAVTVRKTGRTWSWTCNNDNCGWVGVDLGSQQAALREACRHLAGAFDQHHGLDRGPTWNETEQRATATCHCGYEAEEKTEAGAESSIELHAHWLRQELPAARTA
jgi:hypothetical protein